MPIVAPLVALDVLVLVLWAIAVALAIALLMDKLASILHAVPIAGGYLSDKVHDMARAITNAAGTLEKGIDHLIGAAWHQFARYTDKLWSELVSHSAVLVQLAQTVGHLVHSVHGLRALVRALEHAGHGVTAAVKKLEREYHGIEHRVKVIERDIAKGIGHDLRIRIKALEKWEEAAKDQLAADAKAITQTLPGEISSLRDWLGAKTGVNFKDWAAGLVLAGLAALGLSGLASKCNPLRSTKDPCAWWTGLDDLLGLAATLLVAEDLGTLIHEMQAVAEETTKIVADTFGVGH